MEAKEFLSFFTFILKTELLIAFPCFILREQFGNNLGTDMLKQHATSVASCMVILEHNSRNRQLFFTFPLFEPLSH